MNEEYEDRLANGSFDAATVAVKKPAVIQALDDQQRTVRQLTESLRILDERLAPILEIAPESERGEKLGADASPMLADNIIANTRFIADAIRKVNELNRRIQI